MSKSNVFVGVVALAALVLAGGGLVYTYMATKERAAVSANLGDFDLSNVAGYAFDEATGDVAIELKHELKGGNTALVWEMAKNKPNDRMEFDGTWDVLSGGLVYNPEAKELKALEVVLATDSVVGYGSTHPAPPTLTETLRGNTPGLAGWFDIENHPEAVFKADTFVATEAVPEGVTVFDNAPEGWTHLIRGTFALNGKTIDLDIPARVEFIDKEVVVDLAFQIDRMEFGIDGKIVGGWEVEPVAYLSGAVQSVPKGDAMLAALRAQGMAVSDLSAELSDLRRDRNRIAELESQLAALQEQLEEWQASGGTAQQTPQVDTSNLPKTFADAVTYPNRAVPFEMVLVPGDAGSGVGPFYMAATEVTWEMFNDWAYSTDIGADLSAELQLQNLRPSPLYEDCEQVKMGKGDRPAVSMSRTTAEAFAKWLSEQTGRSYRLPTDAEWQHALAAGGGVPTDQEALFAAAVLNDNAEKMGDVNDPFFDPTDPSLPSSSAPVGQKQPNALGIYDLIGNAAEWVVGTGAERIVRGGHFQLPADQVGAEWKSVEDQDIWNATYPQKPNSRFWYRDHYYQGIRLVCDPVNLPE